MELFLSFLAGCGLVFWLCSIKINRQDREIVRLNAENGGSFAEFENVANRLLKQNSEEFSKTGKREIDELIKPFKEKIVELTDRIEKNRLNEVKDLSSLETQIKLLSENNQKICEEASNLAGAIKGDSKMRGNWGEAVLERILEVSGLQKDVHYACQQSFRNDENSLLVPDVVVYMPQGRQLVIDSKVSLIAYEKFYNSDDAQYLKDFLNSVREHLKNLKSKFYQELKGINSPDFVLMFMPIESSFSLLLHKDTEILDFARKNNVLLVSPSTLLVSLKTIELFWQQDNQSKNVTEIAEESGKLYDKFVGLLSDIGVLRNCFAKTLDGFDNINTKLEGKGGLIGRVEKIKSLGAKTSKKIPKSLLS